MQLCTEIPTCCQRDPHRARTASLNLGTTLEGACAMAKLTPKQQQIYDYILAFADEHG